MSIKKFKEGLGLQPLSADPGSPVEGQLQFSDGTARSAGLWQYKGGSWVQIADAGAAGYSQASLLNNIGLSIVLASNAVTIHLKQSDGSSDATSASPINIGFRHTTITTGAYNVRTVTSSLSTNISSGSTAGTANATENIIYIYVLDNAGTVELAWSRMLFENENELVTTVAEGGAGGADDNGTIYSTTQRTSVPFRLIGSFTSTQATAGTWVTNPSEVFVGNQQVMAREKVELTTHCTTGQTIDNTSLTVKYTTKLVDTHNAYDTSTGLYTVPRSGTLRARAGFTINDVTVTDVSQLAAYILLNSTKIAIDSIKFNSAGLKNQESVIAILQSYPVNKGDVIEVQGFSTISTTLKTTSYQNQLQLSIE